MLLGGAFWDLLRGVYWGEKDPWPDMLSCRSCSELELLRFCFIEDLKRYNRLPLNL